MSRKFIIAAAVFASAVLLVLGVGPSFAAAGYTLFGDATLVSPGNASATAAQIESSSTVPPGYGGVDFAVPAGLTVADLDNLATDYMFTAGSCGGGAPRFVIDVTNGSTSGDISVYIGPPPNYTGCPLNVWSNTGNLASPANLVDTTHLPGGAFYDPYALAQTKYGSYQVTGIQLVTDGSWVSGNDPQTVRVDNVQINNSTTTFESKDSCKKGGWQNFTSAPGPFKNQGDCVSYFSSGH